MLQFYGNDTVAADAQSDVFGTPGNGQEKPAVARLSEGGFVVVLRQDSGIWVQVFDAHGAAVGQAKLLVANGRDPSVTALASGGFAVAWSASDASLDGIYLRVFDSAGTPASATVQVNENTFGNQSQPSIQLLADGTLVVAWTDNGTSGIGSIAARVFTSAGSAVTATLVIASDASINSYDPDLAALPGGGFAVSWTGPRSGSFTEANLRLVDAAYAVQPVSFSSRDAAPGPSFHDGFFSSVAVLASGAMVVTWTDNSATGVVVKGQLLDTSGGAIGTPFQIGASGVESGQSNVTALDNGGFMVTWRVDTPASGPNYVQRGDIMAQIFDSNGVAMGPAFGVNTDTAFGQDLPVVSQFGSGDIVIAFHSYSASFTESVKLRTYYSVTDGTAQGETIEGSTSVDVIRAFGGDDVVSALAENDWIYGGDGNDTIDGGLGADRLLGEAGDDLIRFSAVSMSSPVPTLIGEINGGSGYDTLDLSGVSPVIVGRIFNENNVSVPGIYVGSQRFTLNGIERINLGAGDNSVGASDVTSPLTVYGGEGNDDFTGSGLITFYGEGGNDTFFISGAFGTPPRHGVIDGGSGYNTLKLNIAFSVDLAAGTARSGVQTYSIANVSEVLVVPYDSDVSTILGDGNDNVFAVTPLFADRTGTLIYDGRGGNDRLTGGLGNDSIAGGTGNDQLDGNAGHDVLDSGSGTDMLLGGDGNDGLYFGAHLDAADRADGGAGTLDQVGLQGNYGAPFTFDAGNFTGIEVLALLPGNDTRFGDPGTNFYDYNLKTVDANVGAGQRLVVGFNTLRAGEDVTFDGSAETDGFFLTYGGNGTDAVTGGQRDDGFFFGSGRWGASDVVNGQGGTLDQLGLQGEYTIVFGASQLVGIEAIALLTGFDTRFGGGGAERYDYNLTMNDGNVASGQTLVVSGNVLASDETLIFNGSAETNGRFVVYGGAGNDVIRGGASGDDLRGGAGADTITGGLGADMLRGGLGADTFAYLSTADSTALSIDQILDFANGDKIDLGAIDADGNGANGDTAFTHIGNAAFSGTAGQLRTVLANGVWTVEGDTNGDSIADFVISVTTEAGHNLVPADFQF